MIRLIGFMLLLLSAEMAGAQVGINNRNPDPASVLDLQAVDKGLLIPRMTTAFREAIKTGISPKPMPTALLVFDTDLGVFCFYGSDGKWYVLNEWTREAGSTEVVTKGNVTIQGAAGIFGTLQTTGTIIAPNYALNANGNGPVPAGGIIMWSGAVDNIPVGWALCNGSQNTPDLRDRFIVAAGGSYGRGAGVGQQNLVTLGMNNIPRHSHSVYDPGHTHANGDYAYLSKRSGTGTVAATDNNGAYEPNVVEVGEIGWVPTNISVNPTGGNAQGNADSFDNRPPYYALAFIMKLP